MVRLTTGLYPSRLASPGRFICGCFAARFTHRAGATGRRPWAARPPWSKGLCRGLAHTMEPAQKQWRSSGCIAVAACTLVTVSGSSETPTALIYASKAFNRFWHPVGGPDRSGGRSTPSLRRLVLWRRLVFWRYLLLSAASSSVRLRSSSFLLNPTTPHMRRLRCVRLLCSLHILLLRLLRPRPSPSLSPLRPCLRAFRLPFLRLRCPSSSTSFASSSFVLLVLVRFAPKTSKAYGQLEGHFFDWRCARKATTDEVE